MDHRGGAGTALLGPPRGPGGVLLPRPIGRGGGESAGCSRGDGKVPHPLCRPGATARAPRDGGDTMTCEFTFDDGAYVLGALSPAERAAFERHLPGCASCRESVADLAVLPGLLG